MPRLAIALLFFLPRLGFAQVSMGSLEASGTEASDAQAVSLAARSMVALANGVHLVDVVMNGTAIRFDPSGSSGTVKLVAKGWDRSRLDFSLGNRSRSEVRDDFAGYWQDSVQTSGGFAPHNCLTDAIWFMPALSVLSRTSDPKIVAFYVGVEDFNGISAQHIRIQKRFAFNKHKFVDLEKLSTMDFYLDAASLLPLAIKFYQHPEDDLFTNLLAQVLFADYRSVNGVLIPFHVQRLLDGHLLLDVQIGGAEINSGVPDSVFNVN